MSLGIVASGNRAQSSAGLGSAFPPVSPKVTEAFVSRKPPPGRPASPLFWCLVGMLWVVLVLLLPAVSGRSLQSGRAGGEPERLARPADWSRGWEEICFLSLVRVVGLGPLRGHKELG